MAKDEDTTDEKSGSHEKKHEHKVEEKKVHEHVQKKEDSGLVWKVASGALVILLVISIFTGGFGLGSMFGAGAVLPADQAGSKAVDYLNKNLLPPGTSATVKSIQEVNDVYNLKLDIGGKEFDTYVTKDGKYLFPSAFDTTKEVPSQLQEEEQQPETIAKSDKPKVDLYVMSFCPFGNRAEDTMYPVYKLLKDKVEWNIHYIVSASGDTIRSLHGQPETDQNIREVCVKRDFGLDKFWKFVGYVNTNCGRDGSCWKDAAKDAGVDATKIQQCFDKEGLALMKSEAAASDKAGAQGSPTLIINGAQTSSVYKYGQSDVYKDAICGAFNKAPAECEQKLAEQAAATAASGSCG